MVTEADLWRNPIVMGLVLLGVVAGLFGITATATNAYGSLMCCASVFLFALAFLAAGIWTLINYGK